MIRFGLNSDILKEDYNSHRIKQKLEEIWPTGSSNVTSEMRLIMSVVLLAVEDLQSKHELLREDALEYFRGDVFEHHMYTLGFSDAGIDNFREKVLEVVNV